MTSQLLRKGINILKSSLVNRSCEQVRWAGHAKWQNIKNTKQANDLAKGKLISRYVLMVRRAIITNGRIIDPKLNSRLATVLAEANKLNVPKATLERAITRAANVQVKTVNVEFQGPQGSSLIVKCETDNKNMLKKELKKVAKKFDAVLLPDESITNMFRSQGQIRASTKRKDDQILDHEGAEDAAIIANAQEVLAESDDVWLFTTESEQVNSCRGELEKLGIQIIDSEVELVPYRCIRFSEDTIEKIVSLCEALRELDQVVDVYHNVDMSQTPE